jgi:hypothetical protein
LVIKILNYLLIQQKSKSQMLSKKQKRNKGIDILARQENQTPVAIAAIAKVKIFRLSFRKYFIALRILFLGAKKGKGGGITDKRPKRLIWLTFIAF